MTIQLTRRTVALALAAFLALTGVATTSLVLTLSRNAEAGAGFSDTPPWAAAQINWLAANGIATGYSDGTFKPNDNITRAQAAFWFSNYNNAIEIVSEPVPASASATARGWQINCPIGKRAISGGFTGGFQNDGFMLRGSRPLGRAWDLTFVKPDSPGPLSGVTAYAICIPDPISTNP